MRQPVFISYARSASRAHAQALAARLDGEAFLDTEAIEDGDRFPPRLLNALLEARVVAIFATATYLERRFCRLEMRLALAAGDAEASHLVMALGEGSAAVLDAMPPQVSGRSWPPAEAAERLEAQVRRQLKSAPRPLSSRLPEAEAQTLAAAFLEEANVPEPRALDGIPCSWPPGAAMQSIGGRFVGRAARLRELHRVLVEGRGGAARRTSRIAAGFGKTRLASEYLHRYGPRYYPGGLLWVNAASSALDEEFWRVLSELDRSVPALAAMRHQGRDVKQELGRALRAITPPALFVIDNIPEAAEQAVASPADVAVAERARDLSRQGLQIATVGDVDPTIERHATSLCPFGH